MMIKRFIHGVVCAKHFRNICKRASSCAYFIQTYFRSTQEILKISENLIGNNSSHKQNEIRSYNENIGSSAEVLTTNSQKVKL